MHYDELDQIANANGGGLSGQALPKAVHSTAFGNAVLGGVVLRIWEMGLTEYQNGCTST